MRGMQVRLSDDPWVHWLLESARTKLGTTIAWVSEFSDADQVIQAATGDLAAMNVSVGMTAPMEGSFCARVLAGQLPPVVTAADRDARTRDLAITSRLGIGSYVGAPIRSPRDGRPVGMLCCLGRDDGAQLDGASARLLEFLAQLLGEHIASSPLQANEELLEATARITAVLRNGAVQPVFQPIIQISTGNVVAYEALARFTGADTATVFSDATRTGRGLELEALAARAALAAARQRPLDVTVGINLSPKALTTPSVLDSLLQYRGGRIGVELTEHAPVEDYGPLIDARQQLRDAGITLSIDDAGSGYASMRHVLRLQPDVIKLDASIVSDVHLDPAKQALTLAMQTFTNEIGAILVAEGIETVAERETLTARGIDFGQGWLWGRPTPFPR